MFMTSIKQLFRRPGRALLFFLLIAAVTALLVFSAVSMVKTNLQIDAAENQFTTIATVTQHWQQGDTLLRADMLDFQGTEYINGPETRPFLLAYNPALHSTSDAYTADSIHIVVFTPLEDCTALEQIVKVEIQEAMYNKYDAVGSHIMGYSEQDLSPGKVVPIVQKFDLTPLEVGKTYIANLSFTMHMLDTGSGSENEGYMPVQGPFTTQHTVNGQIKGGNSTISRNTRIDEVTDGFWGEGGRGQNWLNWIRALQLEKSTCPLAVAPTESVNLIPAFHSKQAFISSGQEIKQEEFLQGAKVCVVSHELLTRNVLKIGDKIRLPMRVALYGFIPTWFRNFHFNLDYSFTPLDAEGKLYESFWDEEYEIVGAYKQVGDGLNALDYDTIIVPTSSIGIGWEDHIAYYQPMNGMDTSFQILNGKIAAFHTALNRAVPDAARLEIVYDDNGYEDMIDSLKSARLSAGLLLGVGIFSALTVVILLLYFFVVKERRRTAVERSMGVSRHGCRVSLLAGIFVLTLPAVILGSYGSWLAMETKSNVSHDIKTEIPPDSMETAYFSRDFSLWAENEHSETDIYLDRGANSVQIMLYIVVPLGILLIVLILSAVMTNYSLRIEPIMLLGGQNE
ncbi:FtsX-like permease family protein [Acutalibacter caecimuris]|uniref:FtsX-like permease family protein n=1 Tax=Acutalibacter caecimuris TaxID=3093657 RepID=UPI002AC96964|nr:FtsX-like permease family protein [Acutalibacter sp. M00118]